MRRTQMMVVAALAAVVSMSASVSGQAVAAPVQKLAPVNAEGKIERLEGLVELVAIRKAENIPAETKEKIKPLIRNWLLDVQQQVIDNIDFIAEIEPFDGKPGFFETFDPANPKMVERIGAFSRQLTSAGPLLSTLEFRRALDSTQTMAIRQAAYQYDFAVLQEVMAGSKDHMVQMRHQYRTGYRDAIFMFHRLLDKAAVNIDEAFKASGASAETAAAAAPQIAAIKAAKGMNETRTAVKALLQKLNLQERRALMLKVRDLSPIEDPYQVAPGAS